MAVHLALVALVHTQVTWSPSFCTRVRPGRAGKPVTGEPLRPCAPR